MTHLVTGGCGFLGSLIARQLLERGERVRVLDVWEDHARPREIEYLECDIRDRDGVRQAVKGIDVVHHNVAQVPLAKDRRLFETVNIGGTDNLLQACQAAGVRKIVATSSSAVFGVPKANPVTEETPPSPGEAYGRAKAEAEVLCKAYIERGLDVTIIRPRTILGHGRLGIFQLLFEWIRTGYNVPVLGRGDNRYQFVHAHDVADACIRAGERAGASVYNVGADRFGTMRQALEALCQHAGTGSRVVSVPFAPAVLGMKLTSAIGLSPLGAYHSLMYGRELYFDVARARSELSWQPVYSNDEMLIDSYQWYLAHRDEVIAARGASPHRSAVRQGVLNLVKRFV